MARKRMISPEMFTSATVAGWSAATRWTWLGLICYLNDHGYGEDSAALVKAAAWPRDDYPIRKVAADIDRIVADGSLCRFTCCTKPQFHSPTWTEWQKVSHPTDSRLCPCPNHAGLAHEIHRNDSGAAPRSVVELSRDESSSSGEDGLAAAKQIIGSLGQRKNAGNDVGADVA